MKLKIDLTDPRHVAAAAAFFNSLAGVVPDVVLSIAQKKDLLSSEEDLKKGRAKRTKPAKIETPAAEAPTPGPTKQENEELRKEIIAEVEAGQKESEGEATLEVLQDLVPMLSKASKDNIPKMRDKLIELGAKRVSSLTSDKYQEFYDFLKTLDNAGA